MNMYIAQARSGRFEIVESLGAIDPQEPRSSTPALTAVITSHQRPRKENHMLLATTQIEDFDRFLQVFSTAGADKRRQHGSKGAASSATRPKPTASGSSSTGTSRAGRVSSPTRGAGDHEGGGAQVEAAGRRVAARCDA